MSQISSNDLRYNLPANGKAVQAAAEQYLTKAVSTGKPDLIIVDPPRGGLGDTTARAMANMAAPRVTYVSCDPATLARDLVPLQAAGYRVEELHLVDLFPQTYHLETVAHLIR
jgi:23S rRNA (uracil1939-C5)-methyltransferase